MSVLFVLDICCWMLKEGAWMKGYDSRLARIMEDFAMIEDFHEYFKIYEIRKFSGRDK